MALVPFYKASLAAHVHPLTSTIGISSPYLFTDEWKRIVENGLFDDLPSLETVDFHFPYDSIDQEQRQWLERTISESYTGVNVVYNMGSGDKTTLSRRGDLGDRSDGDGNVDKQICEKLSSVLFGL